MNKDLLQKEYEVEAFNAGMKKAYERAAEETEKYAEDCKAYGQQFSLNGFNNLAHFFRQMAK